MSSIAVRVILPALVAIAGLVMMGADGARGVVALGLLFVVVGGFVAVANLLARLEKTAQEHRPHRA